MNNENVTNIQIEKDGDIIFVTMRKYKLFLATREKGGIDAFILYSHLMFTGRLQDTNQVYANNEYLMNGLGWGKSRLLKAKKLLKELGLIEIKQGYKENGDFDKGYIKIITTSPMNTKSTVVSKADGVSSGRRESADKCLREQNKCLREQNKNIYTPLFLQFWEKYPFRRGSKQQAAKAFNARLSEGVSEQELQTALDNYCAVKKNTERQFILNAQTFFGPNERWKEYLDIEIDSGKNKSSQAHTYDPLASGINYVD